MDAGAAAGERALRARLVPRRRRVPLYVSRGIDTSVAPVRFAAPPEVAVFTMWV
jgi:predicted MPP superfamily phosphohydrolase